MSVRSTRSVAALGMIALLAAPRAEAQSAAAWCARGTQLGYNLDYAEALASFTAASAADPQDPAFQRMVAASAWTAELYRQGAITVADYLGQARATLPRSGSDPSTSRLVHDAVERAIALSEQRVQANPNDPEAHYQLGAAYGVLASYTATVE